MNSEVVGVLYDLREQGAEAPFFLEAKLGKATVESLIEKRYLRILKATPAGSLILLGSAGRELLGLSPNYLSPPEIAADQYLQRRCVAALRSKGWSYSGNVRGLKNVLELQHDDGRKAYLFARWKRPSARSVRRVLEKLHRSVNHEKAMLLVRTDLPHTLKGLSEKYRGQVKPLSSELYRKSS